MQRRGLHGDHFGIQYPKMIVPQEHPHDRRHEPGRIPHRARKRHQGQERQPSPFSVGWASGKLSREHLARWAENHYHYVGPFADYLGYIYARMPEGYTEAKDFLLANMYEEEIGGDRHTDLLVRFGADGGRPLPA